MLSCLDLILESEIEALQSLPKVIWIKQHAEQ